LVGGASNTGCAVLREQGFTDDDLSRLSEMINPNIDSGFSYYPLTSPGERFPTNDPQFPPVLDPKPMIIKNYDDSNEGDGIFTDTEWRKQYLWGILEGIAKIEKDGYAAFKELGASPLTEVKLL
jgi:hypothetical protein